MINKNLFSKQVGVFYFSECSLKVTSEQGKKKNRID